MKNFTYNGVKYLNGYACDALGRPITIKNGYSSEDEKDAKESFNEALELFEKQTQKNKGSKNKVEEKFGKKIEIKEEISPELYEMYMKEYHESKPKSQEGFMLNDAGEKISLENGYTDLDEKITKRQVKTFNM